MDCLDGLKKLPDNFIDTVVTSPPYWGLRDYGVPGQVGLEDTLHDYLIKMTDIFREVKRVLKDEGTVWLNLGDSYVGTGGDRKKPVKREIFNIQQSNNPHEGRYERIKKLKENNLKPKDLIGIPWRVAFALQDDGWYLRSDIIWEKSNCMPEAVKDRPTKAHEYIFLMSKSNRYYYDYESIMEDCVNGDPNPPRGSIGAFGPHQNGRRLKGNRKTFRGSGAYTQNQAFNNHFEIINKVHGNEPNKLLKRNKRTVWTVATAQCKEAHFATFPEKLIEPCIIAGSPEGGIVLDIFMGSGTTALVALQNRRNYIGFELNPKYIQIAENRLSEVQLKIV